MLVGIFCWPLLLCARWIRIHQIRLCRLAEWDTVDIFPPIVPNLVLPRLYCRCPCCTAYLLPYLSSISLIILHIFCFTHCIASLPHICCCYFDRLTYPPHFSSSRLCLNSPPHVSASRIRLTSPPHVSASRLCLTSTPHISAVVSNSILINRPCHLSCLIML